MLDLTRLSVVWTVLKPRMEKLSVRKRKSLKMKSKNSKRSRKLTIKFKLRNK